MTIKQALYASVAVACILSAGYASAQMLPPTGGMGMPAVYANNASIGTWAGSYGTNDLLMHYFSGVPYLLLYDRDGLLQNGVWWYLKSDCTGDPLVDAVYAKGSPTFAYWLEDASPVAPTGEAVVVPQDTGTLMTAQCGFYLGYKYVSPYRAYLAVPKVVDKTKARFWAAPFEAR